MKANEDNSNTINTLIQDVKLHQFLNCGHLAVIYLDNSGIIQYLTPYMEEIIGLTKKNRGQNFCETSFASNHPDICRKIFEKLKTINTAMQSKSKRKLDSLQNYQASLEIKGNDKRIYQIDIRIYSSDNATVNGIILIFYDITKRKTIEEDLTSEKEKYRIIAELTDSALWEYDISTKTLKQYNKLKGRYSKHFLTIKDYRNTVLKNDWVHPEDLQIFEEYCDSMDRGDEYIQYELRAYNDNKNYIWLRYQGAVLKDKDGNNKSIIGRTINIDREYKDRERLINKLERDPLTGLYNRSATKEKIELFFQQCKDENIKNNFSFMIIDIDNFKKKNDQWGHLYGDMILEQFSKQLENLFDSTDIVGRIGGDEFVVLQKNIQEADQLEKSAKAICHKVRTFMNSRNKKSFTVSIGIASYPKDGSDYDTLYRKADIALYKAKSKGKDQYSIYNPEMANYITKGYSDKWDNLVSELSNQDISEIDKRLLNMTFDIVNESAEMDHAIKGILKEVGTYYDLSRITIFEVQIGNIASRVSYEWLNIGIESCNYSPTPEPETIMKDYQNLFQDGYIYYFNDVTTAKTTPELKKLYDRLGTKALIQLPIFDGDKFIGSINYEDCIAARRWSKRELDTLNTLTKLLSTFIIRLKNKQELDNEVFFTQATLNNQKLCNYAIRSETYELLYFSEYTNALFPDIKLGELCYKALYSKDSPCDTCPLKGLNDNNSSYSIEAYDDEKDSWYSSTASAVTMPNGESIRLICSSDVTGFISRVNSKDSLTGLLTLSKFEAEAMKLISASSSQKYFIIYSDFDHFKNINDEWGYSTGNEVLITYANIVSKYLKPKELFCRIAADTFVLLISYSSEKEAFNRLERDFALIEEDFRSKFPKLNMVITSGMYFLTPSDKIISVAIDKANIARKTIKGIHRSSYVIYDKSLHDKVTKENMIANNMYEALKNNEFVVYFQPKIDLSSSKIIGAEALVRWQHPSGRLIGPMEFIPVFEKNGFIRELDFYVYERTLQALRSWLDEGKQEIIVSVNVSRVHLMDSGFVESLMHLIKKYNIPSSLIELEIAESMFFMDLKRLTYVIGSLRERGFLISIDDFGSGYSSLNVLKTLPIDIIKLDREFFMKNEMGYQDKIVISGIISLVKGLGLKVISEGVETPEQVSFLKESSCDMAQGYLFYKPMPMDEFSKLLS